jgi:hypothetical protein
MYLVYAQRNVPGGQQVPWWNQRLGTVDGVTIGSDGCYVTADAQVATHFEHVINPAQLDNRMTDLHLYVAGDLMTDRALSQVFTDILYVETRSWPGAADLNYLAMADDEEIIIGLDNLNQGAKARHFARVFDYNPKTGVLMIDDPWWGVTLNFASKYGSPSRNVMKAIKYRRPGWIPPWKRVAAPLVVIPPVVVPPVVIPPVAADPRDAQITALTAERDALSAKLGTDHAAWVEAWRATVALQQDFAKLTAIINPHSSQ